MDAPSPLLRPSSVGSASQDDPSNLTVEIPSSVNSTTIDGEKFASLIEKKKKKKKKSTASANPLAPPASSSSSSSSCCMSSYSKQRGLRVSSSRRNPRVLIGSVRQKESDVEALALPLGMSIAAVVAQVLERKDAAGQRISVDHLSTICTLAIRESLANVFGNKFDCFVRSFEKSFRSTLMTLCVINESSRTNGARHRTYFNGEACQLDHMPAVSLTGGDSPCPGEACQVDHMPAVSLTSGDSPFHSGVKDCLSEAVLGTIHNQEGPSTFQEIEGNMPTDLTRRKLVLHEGQVCQQLACFPPSKLHFVTSQSILSTLEKSVIEQARSNDLKTFEIGLVMKKLRMKEAQLALNSYSNLLERFKLSIGVSKASFKAEKFKNELKDARHAELLKTCIDCLVAGMLIMLACIGYGTYVYSHRRITEATASCTPIEGTNSWWIPKPMASFNSGLKIMWCQIQVMSRMLFGVLMILAVSYMLLQRSASSQQTMPITFLLLLLGVACGFAGKLCMDTLGGDGYQWLIFWEALCLLHFFANEFTSALFFILHGPITVSEKARGSKIFPYWLRRFLFYTTVLLFLPLLSGLTPFASPAEWREHFSLLVMDLL